MHGEVERLQTLDERVDPVLLDVQHDHLLLDRGASLPEPCASRVPHLRQGGAVDAADRGRSRRRSGRFCRCTPTGRASAPGLGGRRSVDQLPPEVLLLQHLAELLRAPVGHEELQPGAGAQPPVAVVTEDRDDALVDVRDLVQRDPGHRGAPDLRVGRQTAADPQVEARAVLGVDDADEGDVVDLVRHVEQRRSRDRGLELARQVRERRVADDPAVDLVDGRGAVDDLVLGDAGDGRTEDDAGVSPQASVVDSPTASRRFQISGTSSIRIQWYWTFCRSVMSAVPRANSCEISPMVRSWRVVRRPPSMRTRSMK